MYQALYRKYRPQTFDDVVGQQGVTQTLKNQLQTGRLSHAYLFTGTRGTGKTTCAKILAKAVNCENPQDGNPCNRCAACRSIDAGACMDVLEIDAASNNGVDSVRALRDDAVYTPAEVKKRVYIIDEVHMLSLSAFNALLKIIEEPPEHLLFILATTELHKVPATILSRCQRFAFRRIVPEDIVGRLNYIAYQESIELEPDAAAFLARLADGGLRDAVSLLDQCASAAQGAVTVDEACKVLGLAGARQTAALMEAVGRHDAAAALSIFNTQYAEGKDLGAMLDELCAVARDLLILRTAPQAGIQMISGICTPQELRTLQPLLSPGELLRITAVLRDTAAGFNASANRRIDAELCLVRLCEPEASLDAESLNARLCRVEERLARGVVPVAAAPQAEQAQQETAAPEESEEPEAAPEPQQSAPSEAPPGFWPELVKRLKTTLPLPEQAMFSTQDNAPVCGTLHGDLLELRMETEFVRNLINKPEVLQPVADAATALLGRSVRVRIASGKAEKPNKSFARLVSFGEEHPELVKAFLTAQKQVLDEMDADHAAAVSATAKATGLEEAAVEEMYGLYDFDMEIKDSDIEAMEKTEKFMEDTGMIENPVDVASLILDVE